MYVDHINPLVGMIFWSSASNSVSTIRDYVLATAAGSTRDRYCGAAPFTL